MENYVRVKKRFMDFCIYIYIILLLKFDTKLLM